MDVCERCCISCDLLLVFYSLCADQRLDLTRGTSHDDIVVRGHLTVSLASQERSGSVVTMLTGNTSGQLPEG